MRFEHQGQQYLVKFSHEVPGKEEKKGYRKTVCHVYLLLPEDRSLVATGTATCGPMDQFVKETGRKVSLTRALQQSLSLDLNRALRAAIWKSYFDRKPKTAKPML